MKDLWHAKALKKHDIAGCSRPWSKGRFTLRDENARSEQLLFPIPDTQAMSRAAMR
jgi:hypothetical protein